MVVAHSEVVRAFVRGENAEGSRMFSENGIVYSYGHHFPIAIRTAWGYIFNKDGYSSSTAKHKNYVLYAITNHFSEVIHLTGCNEGYVEETYRENLKEIEETMAKMKRARTENSKERHEDRINFLFRQNELLKKRYLKELFVEKL